MAENNIEYNIEHNDEQPIEHKVDLIQVAEDILKISKNHGCEAQVTMIQTDSKDISLRNGEVEQLLTSVAISTGIRLFKNNKSTIMAFSGEDFDNLESKIETSLHAIEYLNKDEYKRLLKPGEFDTGEMKNLDLADGEYETLNIADVKNALKSIEARALAYSDKIIPSEMADFSASQTDVHLFTTEGVRKSFFRTYYTYSYSAVAEENGLKERDFWSENKRHLLDLPEPKELERIGEIAAERALKRLGGKKIKSGEKKVVFYRRSAASLLDLLCDALDGEEVVFKNSFLVDKLGEKVFPEIVTVIDDPLIKRFPGSYPFDGEGMNGRTKTIIDKGKILTFLHNSYSAGKMGHELTGNASREVSSRPHIAVGNFYLQAGQGSLEDLFHEMKDGLFIDDLYVSGINSVTGDFSFGCSGFLVENGVITAPVKEITIAGNIMELFQNVTAIADDNLWKASITSPSILVSKMAVSGT
jgi:PmbA protein